MTVHILLPAHNRAAVTRRFAMQLREQTVADYHLVLVDDGSTDGTSEAVRELIPPTQLTVIRGSGSLWWAGALQLGYEFLRDKPIWSTDAVLVINDDVEFERDMLQTGLLLLAGKPNAAFQAVGRDKRTGLADRGVMADVQHLEFRGAAADEKPNCLSTRGLLMTGLTFLESGGFRPRWLPHYLSDYEYTLRLAKQGVQLASDDRFCITTDSSLTGDSEYARGSLADALRSALSHRSKMNPKHWSAFALMVCPWHAGLVHAAKIWVRFLLVLIRTGLGKRAR